MSNWNSLKTGGEKEVEVTEFWEVPEFWQLSETT
jgi:hypothetical protein